MCRLIFLKFYKFLFFLQWGVGWGVSANVLILNI